MKTAAAIFMPYVCTVVGSSEVGMKVAFATFILKPVTEGIIDVFFQDYRVRWDIRFYGGARMY